MRGHERFLHALTNPNVTYVLFLVGIYGIIHELASPGAILPGVAGAISIILALMGFGGLPISIAGMLLLTLGAILLVLEIFVASNGILALGGLAALLFGSFMIFPSELPAFKVAHSIIWTMFAISAAYAAIFIYVVIRLRKAKVISGTESLMGERGYVKPGTLGGRIVHVQGDDWLVTPDSGKLEPGQEVEVVEVKGLRLKVRTCGPAGDLKNQKEE
ncbi:nodulation protein NfeD, partial [bacterium]|nr:nodulation protein NfeD [bacterium]